VREKAASVLSHSENADISRTANISGSLVPPIWAGLYLLDASNNPQTSTPYS
jgi:hypothetical protein